MSDWIGLAIILLFIVGGIVASAKLGAPRKQISEEEFQRRVREGQRSQAAVFALQKLMQPKAAEAVAVQQDLRYGYYNKKKIPGEGDDDEETATEPSETEATLTEANDKDAEQTEERDA
jgi:hypothetical protein